MIKKKVLILEGGYNEEHDVSLKTSLAFQKTLKKLNVKFKILTVDPRLFEKKIKKYKGYIFLNALHGPFGEDGQIQKILKKNNIKFTHSNYRSSRLCFDKVATKKIISRNKILTPKYMILDKKKLNLVTLTKLKKKFHQFIIKPIESGSSFGIQIIKSNKDLNILNKNLISYKKKLNNQKKLLVEEYIKGKELTVSTINFSNQIEALAVTQIKSRNSFFDYKAKYSKGFSQKVLPANISKKNYTKCLNIAKKIHKLLGCKSIARSDFILNQKSNKIYFLEINTQPGLTSLSLLPEQAKYKKFFFEDIVLGILKNLN